jgi:hypothetical protein
VQRILFVALFPQVQKGLLLYHLWGPALQSSIQSMSSENSATGERLRKIGMSPQGLFLLGM